MKIKEEDTVRCTTDRFTIFKLANKRYLKASSNFLEIYILVFRHNHTNKPDINQSVSLVHDIQHVAMRVQIAHSSISKIRLNNYYYKSMIFYRNTSAKRSWMMDYKSNFPSLLLHISHVTSVETRRFSEKFLTGYRIHEDIKMKASLKEDRGFFLNSSIEFNDLLIKNKRFSYYKIGWVHKRLEI